MCCVVTSDVVCCVGFSGGLCCVGISGVVCCVVSSDVVCCVRISEVYCRVSDSWLGVGVCCVGSSEGEVEESSWILWLDGTDDGETGTSEHL